MSALSPFALTTLGAARTYVLRKPTDGTQDDFLIQLINGYSQTIRRLVPRQFFPEDAETHEFEYDGSGVLDLMRYELRSVSAITLQPAFASTPTTLDPGTTDYRLQPVEKTDESTYTWLRLRKQDNPRAFPPTARMGFMSIVSITGDWGMEEIPDDAEQACLVSCRYRYKNLDGASASNLGGAFVRYVDPLPPEAMALLDNLSRPDIGV